jgi:hypothetical protein
MGAGLLFDGKFYLPAVSQLGFNGGFEISYPHWTEWLVSALTVHVKSPKTSCPVRRLIRSLALPVTMARPATQLIVPL